MRRLSFAITCLLVASTVAAVRAAEKPTAEYQKAMKDLAAFMGALSKPGAAEDFDLAKAQAAIAKDSFAVTLKYWNGKGAPDAIKLAEAGAKAVADLNVSANLSSAEGIQSAMKDTGATCQACHQAHREKTADGFEIK
jgi:cytochrome c556